MSETKKIENLFNTEGHLTEEGIALWVDALLFKKEDKLPANISEHVEHCLECKEAIVDLYGIMKDNTDIPSAHPFFNKDKKEESVQINSGKKYFRYKIAASIALFLTITVVLLIIFRHGKTNEELFAEYFKPYTNIITTRNQLSDEYNKLMSNALYYYETREYNKANIFFLELTNEGITNDTLMFYYGISSLGNNDPSKAINIFEMILTGQGRTFFQQAEWYLALAYIKNGDKEKAIEMLEKLIDNNTYYKTDAKKLIKELRKVHYF
ncbi:MAG: tetratricopeptide repeat protein [Bacteroidetes bacterium]|nr:tetratricopeptide repeat protein [Bacteroidota bacterium]MBL7102902.1 tetratricopeptide repeat protein [Bacteroidales bacterium]